MQTATRQEIQTIHSSRQEFCVTASFDPTNFAHRLKQPKTAILPYDFFM